MRYLGIDYGKKRIGLALSDEEGYMAFPYSVVGTVKTIVAVIKKEKIKKVIIGIPMTFAGKRSKQTDEVLVFGEKLKKLVQLPIEYKNEILSTALAERGGSDKNKIDASSAAIILQSYLDKLTKNILRITHE